MMIVTITNAKIVTEEIIREFGEELSRIVKDPSVSTLIVNCRMLQYLSSSAIGEFLLARARLGKGRPMILCGFHPGLREVLTITRLDNLFPIAPTLEAALAFMEGSALLSCPMRDCDGWARICTSATGLRDVFRCPSCHVRYDAHPVDSDGPSDAEMGVSWIDIETYEAERIRLLPRQDEISVHGRLDLFAMGAIERALSALPPPRPVLFDLNRASEVTRAGVDALFDWFAAHDGDSAIFLINAGDSLAREAIGGSFRVYTNHGQADFAHATLRRGRGAAWSPTIVYRSADEGSATDGSARLSP
jgi:anti-sigma B factor antagonist